jgi:GNAT superfamily N-acetyltransferase
VPAAVVRPLRAAVLRPGRPPDAAVWAGDDEPTTAHLAAYAGAAGHDPEPVGVVTLLAGAYPGEGHADAVAYQLRGMAVRPELAGRGVGSAMLVAAVELVRGRGAGLLWCNARVPAAAFYERHGFARDGAEFVPPELGIPHVRMRLRLPPVTSR